MVDIKAPLIAGLQITDECNLDCKYCYSWPTCHATMDAKEAIEVIETLVMAGVFSIVIDGGEPFLHAQVLRIIEACIQYPIDVALLTNGTLLGDSEIRGLRKMAHRVRVQVSLDSAENEKNDSLRGGCRQVIQGINALASEGIDTTIGSVVHSQNVTSVDRLIDHFYPRIKQYHFMNLMPSPKSMDRCSELFPSQTQLRDCWTRIQHRQKELPDTIISYPGKPLNPWLGTGTCNCPGCLAGTTRITITPALDVLACCIDRSSLLGNLNAMSFDQIWRSEAAERIREDPIPLCAKNLSVHT